MITYDLLIPSMPHRHRKLCALLAELDRQMIPGAGVILYRDNLEASYAAKLETLTRASQADYVSGIDDDDMVAPDFLARVMAALQTRPDYVGFPVRYTVDGVPQMPVEHSLRHGGWENRGGMLVRDITRLNPIRRELALLGSWDYDDHGVDGHWAWTVRQTGLCKTEAWIDEPMYYYQFGTADSMLTPREPLPAEMIPPLPAYPWLKSL